MDSLRETLERLETSEGFYVKQEWEALEQISSCYEQRNSYTVSSIPQDIGDRKAGKEGRYKYFEAKEQTGLCSRLCCGENRGFVFKFEDFESHKTILQLNRKYRCCGWAVIPCCAHRVDVHAMLQGDSKGGFEVIGSTSDKTLAGQVQVPMFHGGCCFPTLYLKDHNKQYMGKINGYTCWWMPCVVCDICGMDLSVQDKDGKPVGKIEKIGVGSCKDCLYELRTEADRYYVEYDNAAKLDLNFKLAVLASVIQIDFNFFEDKRGCYECHCCDFYCCGYGIPCLPLLVMSICCFCCLNSKNYKEKKTALYGDSKGAGIHKEHDI